MTARDQALSGYLDGDQFAGYLATLSDLAVFSLAWATYREAVRRDPAFPLAPVPPAEPPAPVTLPPRGAAP